MIAELPEEAEIMHTSSGSPALRLIDVIAISIAQGYILARARSTSRPLPVLRLAAVRHAIAWDAALLERELAVFRQERDRIPAKQRPHCALTHRLEILQIMRLRDWSAAKTAQRFVLDPNSVRGWLKALQQESDTSHLFTCPVWNRIHDAVRCTIHQIRALVPDPDIGT